MTVRFWLALGVVSAFLLFINALIARAILFSVDTHVFYRWSLIAFVVVFLTFWVEFVRLRISEMQKKKQQNAEIESLRAAMEHEEAKANDEVITRRLYNRINEVISHAASMNQENGFIIRSNIDRSLNSINSIPGIEDRHFLNDRLKNSALIAIARLREKGEENSSIIKRIESVFQIERV